MKKEGRKENYILAFYTLFLDLDLFTNIKNLF